MLAFFFIPVSLATSIYGMNLQQINKTGHDMWVFVVTAIAILVVALLAWALPFLINNAWRNRRDPRRYYPSREYDSFWHRCKIIITGRAYRSHSENGHSLGRRTPRTEEYEHGSLHERRSSRREQRTSLQDERRSLHTGRSSRQEERGSLGDHDNFRTP